MPFDGNVEIIWSGCNESWVPASVTLSFTNLHGLALHPGSRNSSRQALHNVASRGTVFVRLFHLAEPQPLHKNSQVSPANNGPSSMSPKIRLAAWAPGNPLRLWDQKVGIIVEQRPPPGPLFRALQHPCVQDAYSALERCRWPVIAAIHGRHTPVPVADSVSDKVVTPGHAAAIHLSSPCLCVRGLMSLSSTRLIDALCQVSRLVQRRFPRCSPGLGLDSEPHPRVGSPTRFIQT